ncbi:hypothetical protein F4810DRAFT_669587 [Camillea tinctor]|nr:hypothetical protein F4810DRAFT_669587 [Camillea tinctor]
MEENFEQAGLLDKSEIYEPIQEKPLSTSSGKLSRIQRVRSLVLNILCLGYLLVSLPIIIVWSRKDVPQPYSPAHHVVSYERKPLYFGEDSKYAGLPEDVDAAWDYLLDPINIRVTKQELEQAHATFSNDIVQLTDGDYVSVLSVHHELHCLDALRRNIFPTYYFPNATAEEAEYNIIHMTHCVDTIRRSLMCKADLALYTAYWIGDHKAFPNKELRSKSDTICVNWDAIDEWARSRLLPKDRYKVRPGPFERYSG